MTVDNCPELVKKGIQYGNFVSLRECMSLVWSEQVCSHELFSQNIDRI